MSKFLALGLSLNEVVAAATARPAAALRLQTEWGSLAVGRQANISVLESVPGDYWFFDGNAGNALRAEVLLEPRMVFQNGVPLPCRSFYHIDAEYLNKTSLP